MDLDGALSLHASHHHAAASPTMEDALRPMTTADCCHRRLLQALLGEGPLLARPEGVAMMPAAGTATKATAAETAMALLVPLPAGAGVS